MPNSHSAPSRRRSIARRATAAVASSFGAAIRNAAVRRAIDSARSGDVLAFFVYRPELKQRTLHAVRVD